MAERPEACAAWRDDVAAWVVAQIDPAREAALSAHLATCATCRAEADSLFAVAAVALATEPDGRDTARGPAVRPDSGAPSDAEQPPADLGPRIAARLASERRGRGLRRAGLVAVGSAAAAVVVVVAVALAGGSDGDDLEPLVGDEFAFTVGTGEATVAPDPDTGGSIVELAASGLEPDITYALWLSVPGGGRDDRVAAGTFRPESDGTVEVRLVSAMPADETGRVWATTPDAQLALDTK